jgi:hypothetical protein
MMVDKLRTPFNMSEHSDILSRSVGLCHVEYARRHDVEAAGIERKLLVEGSNDESIVAELMEGITTVRSISKHKRMFGEQRGVLDSHDRPRRDPG